MYYLSHSSRTLYSTSFSRPHTTIFRLCTSFHCVVAPQVTVLNTVLCFLKYCYFIVCDHLIVTCVDYRSLHCFRSPDNTRSWTPHSPGPTGVISTTSSIIFLHYLVSLFMIYTFRPLIHLTIHFHCAEVDVSTMGFLGTFILTLEAVWTWIHFT